MAILPPVGVALFEHARYSNKPCNKRKSLHIELKRHHVDSLVSVSICAHKYGKPGYLPLTRVAGLKDVTDVSELRHLFGSLVCTVIFANTFDQPILQGDIPYSVTHLTFGDKFNQPLPKGCIPSSVTHLTFGQEFECQILPGDIPNSVTYLTFGAKFNQLKPRLCIPDSVMHLTFGTNFDSPVVIPDSVTHLTFGSCFNQASVVIPPSVTHLTFGLSFYQPIRSSDIPDSVTHLTFDRPFNSSSPKVAIPSSVKYLKCVWGSNRPVSASSLTFVVRSKFE